MRLELCIAISAGMAWAAPVRVTLEGTVSAITTDALGMADSLGLTVGSPVSYELELDYDAQPVLIYQGISQTWRDTMRSNGDSMDYFKARLLSGRKIPASQTVVGVLEAGGFMVTGPTHPAFGLTSQLLGSSGTNNSFTAMCQEPTGRLSDATSGCIATETLTLNSATVFAFSVNIGTIRVQGGPTALKPMIPRQYVRGTKLPGKPAYLFQGKTFSVDGRMR